MREMSGRSLSFVLTFTCMTFATVAAGDEYPFHVTNSTDQVIKKLQVSEDGEKYGFFNIGGGIKPGATVMLVWDTSTSGEACDQYFKAVFSDGSESEPAEFNFCEPGLTLEF